MGVRKVSRLIGPAGSVAAVLAITLPAVAAPILQDQTNGSLAFLDEIPGQSFTAEDSTIASFGFFIGDENAGLGAFQITYDFYDGEGTGGALLATRTVDLPDDHLDWLDLDFSDLALAVGQSYTVAASSNSGRGSFALNQHTTLEGAPIPGRIDYVGGNYFLNGSGQPELDARFRVLLAVPEPATLVMFGVGLAGLAVLLRRGRGRRTCRI